MSNGIGEPVERKYTIRAVSMEHGTLRTELDGVLFLAKDKALPATLRYYRTMCSASRADERQLLGIDLLIERVERFQAANPEIVKVAGVEPSRVGDAIVQPNMPEKATVAQRHGKGEDTRFLVVSVPRKDFRMDLNPPQVFIDGKARRLYGDPRRDDDVLLYEDLPDGAAQALPEVS